jgi:hypothetical protein
MDSTLPIVAGVSWIVGWISREYFTSKPEALPCKCECACLNKASDSGGDHFAWVIWSCLVAVLLVVAANAAIAFKVTVTSRGEVKEVDFSVKGKSKGVRGAAYGFQLTG